MVYISEKMIQSAKQKSIPLNMSISNEVAEIMKYAIVESNKWEVEQQRYVEQLVAAH